MAAWVAQQSAQPAVARPVWRAREGFADASGLRPKDLAIRVIGWASAGSRAEFERGFRAFYSLVHRCVLSKRLPRLVLWQRVRPQAQRSRTEGRAARAGGHSGPQKGRHDGGSRRRLRKWMPRRLTQQQLVSRGLPAGWRAGDDEADKAAKSAARSKELTAAQLASHRQRLELASRVARTVAVIQLERVRGRARTTVGSATKERVRQAPGLPRRLRARGVKRPGLLLLRALCRCRAWWSKEQAMCSS